tara:strand:+ start:52 stop:702 length:651 start_codon:yes stop_codon:yes gene_type:complete
MDEYTGFAKWGLLWVLAGVLVWSFFKVLARPSEQPTPSAAPFEPEPEPGPPAQFEGLVFPGQSIVAHATETLETTFDAVGPKRPDEEQPSYYVFLTALVEDAYRQSFREDLGIDSGNYDAFANSIYGAAESDYERRFGAWRPEDEDDYCENFFDAVADASLNLEGDWFLYAEERDHRPGPGAWTRMLRHHHHSDGGDDVDDEAADMIADRIATLRE